ncbi:serine/threonine protein kinase, variant [Aphanomyces invadans]|uniref:Serine/threonine protein kinase, variant n=1 Tax=Aphanomyces invadans TaxID=157072 RepID=A0A024UQ87_9STRA|nr:serine/threonine protein kinase, variant [Aphanomyces invadans]ETW08429.1 serine/threonine protein kinase, variant [Aphanomyces invadans]|eukprot:XP_008862234.1 serine/threonine protein kinase, variant [Aphanomyces invadans]
MGCMQSADASGGLPNTFLRNLSQHHQGVDVFAYYKVIRELGTGAFGVVNLVQNIATGDQYAMKEITIGPNAKLSVLRNEINLWRGLQHPNIVRLVETYESATHIHMIMELCTGGHMLNAVKTRKQAFPEDQAKEIVRKLSSSIYYLHLKNICHRDIKLENILYETDQDGSDVKLCDFGASTLFRNGVLMQTVLGSVVYMAPEFLEGQYTQACDMWSLGVVMYMLLSNSMPFHGNTEEELIESIFAAKVSFEDEVWKDVSLEAKSLIKKLLNPTVAERYSSLQVLRHPWIASAKTNNLPTQDIDRIITQLSEYASFSRMKRAALLAVAFCSPSIDTTAIRKAFDQLNVLHNGVLTLLDLEQASLTDQYPTVDFQKIFQSLDIENSNQVNFLEFVSATMTVNLQSEKVLRKAYGLFSPDETKGGITEASLGRVLGCDFDEASVKEMIRTADVNKDGAVNYNEFVNLLEVRLARSWYRA